MSFVFLFFFWFLMILLTTHLKLMTITRIPQWFIGFGQAFLCLEYFVECLFTSLNERNLKIRKLKTQTHAGT